MTEQEERFALAVAAMIGLVSRGATPMEVRDTVWTYAEFAMYSKPREEEQ